jgi:pimeloyl-ACP methyl ester carboxylesterase
MHFLPPLLYIPSLLVGRPYHIFIQQYIGDLFNHGKDHTRNYVFFLHSLDSHSDFHLLGATPCTKTHAVFPFQGVNHFHFIFKGKIQCPCLIITGTFDFLTPSYRSYQMAHHMPNAILLDYTFGTHFVLLEYSDDVAENMFTFIESQGKYQLVETKP